MRKDIADLWIADLRTNPPQARNRLFDGIGHCCLGRLCVIAGVKPKHDNAADEYRFQGSWACLNDSLVREFGMNSDTGRFGPANEDGCQANLADLNDNGKSFAEIADIIEKHWEEL